MRKDEESGYSQRVLWPELEDRLYEDFLERRKAGQTVRQGWFRIQLQIQFCQLYANVNPTIFRFSKGWFCGCLKRYKISLRSITKKAQKVLDGYKPLVVNWRRFCNMYTCSGNCIQERSAGFPMFSLITLLTLISLIVLQPRSYIKARWLVLSLVLHIDCFI